MMHAIGLIRQRLLVNANAHQEEYELRNIFRDFDVNNNGRISEAEFRGMISKLRVDLPDKVVTGVCRSMDSNSNGAIELDEFVNFMIVDPYKRY